VIPLRKAPFDWLSRRGAKAVLRCALAMVVLTAVAQATAQQPAADSPPLYEQDPYDLVILNELDGTGKPKTLKVEPLALPGRRVPEDPPRTAKLTLRLFEDPTRLFEVRWGSIREVRLFEQIMLAKAVELARAGQREAAYDYFVYLERAYPDLPGLAEEIQSFLYQEAGLHHRRQKLYAALAVLRELYNRNPEYPNLDRALGAVNEQLIARYVAAGDFASARTLVEILAKEYPDHPVAMRWVTDLKGRADRLMSDARAALEAGRFREADEAGRELMRIWPTTPGADELIAVIRKRYPRLIVGVDALTTSVDPRFRSDWAVRRTSRLVFRTLAEYTGPGTEGGHYESAMGTLELEALGRGLVVQIRPGVKWSKGPAMLTGVDAACRLLAMADRGDPVFQADWGDLLRGVSVRNVYRVEINLARPHVRPDAFLQTTVPPYSAVGDPDETGPPNGPFSLETQTPERTVFVGNRQYFAAIDGQPQEIVEQLFVNDREAIRALSEGRIAALDRVKPWTLAEFRSVREIVVRRYAAPRLHCLIPNMNRPLVERRTFRRALVYGIHRKVILDHLLGGREEPGCQVVSGPFLAGESYDDPLGYAYDTDIQPRPFDPHLAAMLAGVSVEMEAAARAKKNGQEPPPKPSPVKPVPADAAAGKEAKNGKGAEGPTDTVRFSVPLTLAHPPEEVARLACGLIKEQLAVVGVKLTLKELPPGPVDRVPEWADLLYAELPIWEPVVDAPRLLGEDGPAGGASDYMNLALQRLREASDWQQVRPRLREIHRIAHAEVAVIPLWQLVDHFAHHRSLKGVGTNPVSLYQNVEHWQQTLEAAPESK